MDLYWTKDAEYGASRQEKKWKTTEEVHGCTVGGYAEGWCGRRE